MSKQNRNGTHIAAARAIRPLTLLLVVSVVAAGALVAFDPLHGQPPQPETQQPEPDGTRLIPRTVTVQDADGTRRTETIFERVGSPESRTVPTRVPQTVIRAFPQTATDRRSVALAARLRQTEDAEEQERLRDELTELLGKAFDERRKLQQQEMERLEARLQSIRELDRRRQELKDKIVQRRLNELLGKGDELAWETSPPATIGSPPIYSPVPTPQTYVRPYPGSGPFHPDVYGDARPKDDDRTRDRSDDVPPVTTPATPEQPFSIRGEQSLDLAERILTLATETAALKNRVASAEKELDRFLKYMKAHAQKLQPEQQALQARQQALQASQTSHEQVLAELRSRLLDSETKLRLAQIAWQGLGTQLQRELEGARRQRLAAEEQLKLNSLRFEQGEITGAELKEAKAAFEAVVSKHDIAESRLDTWKQSERILQERLKAILTPDAEPTDPEDAEQESTETPETDDAAPVAPAARAPQPDISRTITPVSPVEIPDMGSIPGELSLVVASRLLTAASETAAAKIQHASAKKQLDEAVESGAPPRDREIAEQTLAASRANLRASEAKLRLAEVAWKGMGEQLQSELEKTKKNAHAAARTTERVQQLVENGIRPQRELERAKSVEQQAMADLRIAEQRSQAWKKSDRILQEHLKAILPPDAEPADLDDAEQETAETPEPDSDDPVGPSRS